MKGLQCPYCAHSETRVFESRATTARVTRRRRCTKCNRTFLTKEEITILTSPVSSAPLSEAVLTRLASPGVTQSALATEMGCSLDKIQNLKSAHGQNGARINRYDAEGYAMALGLDPKEMWPGDF